MPKIEIPHKGYYVTVLIRQKEEYTWISLGTETGKGNILRQCSAKEEDLIIPLYGQDGFERIQKNCSLSIVEKQQLRKGETLSKFAPRIFIEQLVEERKESRIEREVILRRIEETLGQLHKLFLRDRRLVKNAQSTVNSDIITSMDGSVFLWLSVILSARKDFLEHHSNPKRDEIDDYSSAKRFLLDDSYLILFDGPEEYKSGKAKYVNLSEILGFCIENCKGRKLDATVVDPSIEHLRERLAKDSGDPGLVAKYVRTKK